MDSPKAVYYEIPKAELTAGVDTCRDIRYCMDSPHASNSSFCANPMRLSCDRGPKVLLTEYIPVKSIYDMQP